jgi:hypothetical protein
VYRQGRDRKRITDELQNEFDRIGQLCAEAGALVKPTQVTTTCFSLNNFIAKDSTPIVKLCSEVVERTHVTKNIGVSFVKSLTFAVHIDQVVMKARRDSLQ